MKSNRSKLPPKGWKSKGRTRAYNPPRSKFRTLTGYIFNRWTATAAGLLILTAFFVLSYFWFLFSDRIDRKLLSGDVFTPSAGIYSAPKSLRKGESTDAAGLMEYLKSAGYVEKNNRADASRSRFSFDGTNLLVEPGDTALLDGKKEFLTLSIKFSKDGRSVESLIDTEAGSEIDSALLEPKILSTIAGEGDGRRKTVKFGDLPPHLIKAITVTEDRAFFEHYGVNFRGIARALWQRYDGDDSSPLANQGGSSITQQLVKNLLLTNDPTYERKLTEAYMSVILETRLNKEEIFTLYANQIYLGQQMGVAIYGVGEAADVYFGKDVSQLTLDESAFIAGILRSPNRYNAYKNNERVRERRNQVLQSMLETAEISQAQYSQARERPLELQPVTSRNELQGMPYFSQYVVDELPKLVKDPEALQHLRVYTSIDPDLQRIAYETVAKRLASIEKLYRNKPKGELNAALVAIRPKTGEIVAMVGGKNYVENQFNRATSAKRQPGSVFKPFVFAAAINSAYEPASRIMTAATVFKDEKKVFTYGSESYAPNNYGDYFSNQEITLRDALVRSKNTVTVDIGMQVNIGRVMNLATKAGLPKVERAYPSMALGTAEATPLQVATGYTAFANLGDRVLPMPITKITAGDGSTRVAPTPDKQNVIRPDVAYIMNDIMKDVINRGTAAQLQGRGFRNDPGKAAYAGKTGTSRDGWFAGFTPELVTVVYVGFDNNDDLGLKGSDSAMPIWADFMREALDRHPEWNGDWTMPTGVRRAEIDIRHGTLIREVDGIPLAAPLSDATPTPTPTPDPEDEENGYNPEDWATMDMPEVKEIFVTDVPPEFRRVEFFIAGTIPNRRLVGEDELDDGSLDEEISPRQQSGETWLDKADPDKPPTKPAGEVPTPSTIENILVSICPQSGFKVSVKCPSRESRTFRKGSEPVDFCPIHR